MTVLATAVLLIVANTIDRDQVQPQVPKPTSMVTSWYGEEAGGRMANGKKFKAEDPTIAAHKHLPIGTKLQLVNPENGHSLTVEVQDRGPFVRGRDLDVSEGAAKKLGIKEEGVKTLIAKIVFRSNK